MYHLKHYPPGTRDRDVLAICIFGSFGLTVFNVKLRSNNERPTLKYTV